MSISHTAVGVGAVPTRVVVEDGRVLLPPGLLEELLRGVEPLRLAPRGRRILVTAELRQDQVFVGVRQAEDAHGIDDLLQRAPGVVDAGSAVVPVVRVRPDGIDVGVSWIPERGPTPVRPLERIAGGDPDVLRVHDPLLTEDRDHLPPCRDEVRGRAAGRVGLLLGLVVEDEPHRATEVPDAIRPADDVVVELRAGLGVRDVDPLDPSLVRAQRLHGKGEDMPAVSKPLVIGSREGRVPQVVLADDRQLPAEGGFQLDHRLLRGQSVPRFRDRRRTGAEESPPPQAEQASKGTGRQRRA